MTQINKSFCDNSGSFKGKQNKIRLRHHITQKIQCN